MGPAPESSPHESHQPPRLRECGLCQLRGRSAFSAGIPDWPNWPRTCLNRRKKAKRARFLQIKSTSLSDSPHGANSPPPRTLKIGSGAVTERATIMTVLYVSCIIALVAAAVLDWVSTRRPDD